MVCLRNICINTLHKGDNDNNDDDDDNNNNNNNKLYLNTPFVPRNKHSVSVGKKEMLIKIGICGKILMNFPGNMLRISRKSIRWEPIHADRRTVMRKLTALFKTVLELIKIQLEG